MSLLRRLSSTKYETVEWNTILPLVRRCYQFCIRLNFSSKCSKFKLKYIKLEDFFSISYFIFSSSNIYIWICHSDFTFYTFVDVTRYTCIFLKNEKQYYIFILTLFHRKRKVTETYKNCRTRIRII